MGYLVKYLIVSVVVIAFGFIVGWFYPSNFWMAFIYVGVITVIVYALDSVKTEKDIEEINEMVKLNKNEKVEFTPLKKRKGWKVLLVLIAAMALLSSSLMAVYVFMTNGNTVSQYSGYCLNGFIISLVAAVFLLGVLAVYFIVYSSRRKKNI